MNGLSDKICFFWKKRWGQVQAAPAYTVRHLSLNDMNILPRLGWLVSLLWLLCIGACQSSGSGYRVVESGFMEFEDLFTLVDTVRLDASVLIGQMGFVDLSDRGEFLVTDAINRELHVFSASGGHVRTIEISRCNPEDDGNLLSTRFLKNGSMIATTVWGVYSINADGSCNQRILNIERSRPSFCERQDTVYFLNPDSRPTQIYVYSPESGVVRNYDGIRQPKFPRLTAVKRGYLGRQIACFERGVFYRYAESSDGEPLWPESDPVVVHQPISYRSPDQDLRSKGMNNMTSELQELALEYTYSDGIFELDDRHRMVTFQYPAEINAIIVNMDTETSVSTSIDRSEFLMFVKDGRLYKLGGYEQLPSGELGNKVFKVWQFHPFESSDPDTRSKEFPADHSDFE